MRPRSAASGWAPPRRAADAFAGYAADSRDRLPPERSSARRCLSGNLLRGRRLVLNADLTPAPGAHSLHLCFLDPRIPRRFAASRHCGRQWCPLPRFRAAPHGRSTSIRLQPELLRGGRYSLTLKAEPALAFPVQGGANKSIQSGFGAPRDGGVREHHGIDIFAPRGTPVLAAARGYVTRVNETPRGGRVVWVRDETRSLSSLLRAPR